MVEVSPFSSQLLHFRAVSKAEIILWAEASAFDMGRCAPVGAAPCAHTRPPRGAGAGPRPASPAHGHLTHRRRVRGNSLAEFGMGPEVEHVVHGDADGIWRKDDTAGCHCAPRPVDTAPRGAGPLLGLNAGETCPARPDSLPSPLPWTLRSQRIQLTFFSFFFFFLAGWGGWGGKFY